MKLEQVSKVFGIEAPSTALIPVHPIGDPFAEPPDPHFIFRKTDIKIAITWLLGGNGSLAVTGPTGSGKTEFIKQLGIRTGHQVLVYQATKYMEQEIIGRVTIQPDGSTGFADGMLIKAMRIGAFFLIDEADFAPPGVIGMLNAVLEGRPILIPETGEEVTPHPSFRVALTGNNFSGEKKALYAGTSTPNIAFLDRTIGIHFDYLPEEDEWPLLVAKRPGLKENIARLMVQFAGAVRTMHNEGRLRETLSTRVLLSWATFVTGFGGDDEQGQAKALIMAFEPAMLFRCGSDSRSILLGSLREVGQRLFPQIF